MHPSILLPFAEQHSSQSTAGTLAYGVDAALRKCVPIALAPTGVLGDESCGLTSLVLLHT